MSIQYLIAPPCLALCTQQLSAIELAEPYAYSMAQMPLLVPSPARPDPLDNRATHWVHLLLLKRFNKREYQHISRETWTREQGRSCNASFPWATQFFFFTN
jgi:hypothetical protein